jgi:signal transduction histidine kinase
MSATVEQLRRIDLFDDLDEAALEPWVAAAQELRFEPGEVIAEHSEEVPGLVLLFEGTVEAQLVDGDRVEPAGRHHAPTWIGAIAALTGGPLGARMRAETAGVGARIEADDFTRLVLSNPPVHRRVMQQVRPVMSRITGIEQNRERLASLGTMAAGLAHELNNPAAAARRAAAQMEEALEAISSTIAHFVESGMEREGAEKLVALHREVLAAESSSLSTLDQADAEDELADRIAELGVPEPWRLAEPLAAAGIDRDWVDRVAAVAGPATDAALAWVAATLTAGGLAAELQESTRRMSELVGAVKTYAYMDRGELVEVDLHEGIETTLAILGHRLKRTTIEVVRDYDKGLPKVIVRGSELNQVWTNLLDNAIDALGDGGRLGIATRRDGAGALVEVSDDGPGIPPEALGRIFDDFYTTKKAGHGTGLGLAMAHRIVCDRHHGNLTVDSEPGRTTFRVWLPLEQRR